MLSVGMELVESIHWIVDLTHKSKDQMIMGVSLKVQNGPIDLELVDPMGNMDWPNYIELENFPFPLTEQRKI